MTRLLLALAMLLAVTSAGCSLLGLDRFRFPDCNGLNARDGITDPDDPARCYAWRNDEDTGYCSYLPRDRDNDGHFAITCADGDEPGAQDDVARSDDCDDDDAMAFPGNPEACNGIDDDCNGVVDDQGVANAPPPATVMTTTGGPSWLRSSTLPEAGIAISWANGTQAGFARITQTVEPTEAGDELAPFSQTTAAMAWSAFGRDAEIMTTRGCPTANLLPAPQRRACTFDTDCNSGEVCAEELPPGTRRFCEPPVEYPSPSYPTDSMQCVHSADCDDNLFCNGDVRCAPTEGAIDSITRCRTDRMPACAATDRCDEERLGCVTLSTGGCSASTVSISDASGGQWLAAFTTSSACAAGSVRLGYFVDDPMIADSPRFPRRHILQRGDARRSSVFLGVDVGDTGASRCTGFTRPADAPRGASGLVSASLATSTERRVPQGLVAFFAAPLCREIASPPCAADTPGATGPVDVEVIGAWLENARTGSSATPIAWVHGTGSGIPNRLGAMAIGAGPALGSFDATGGRGYLLAYATASGIAAHVIDALPDPAARCTTGGPRPCIRDDGTTDLPTSGEAPLRTSAPLTIPAPTSLFASAMPVGTVVMALGSPDPSSARIPVGFAWPEASAIVLASAELDPASGTITERAAITRHEVMGVRAGSLSMTHVRTGIRRTEGRGIGGFVAAWSDGRGTWAARLDLDGTAVAPGSVRLGEPTDFPRAFVEHIEIVDPRTMAVERRADVVRVLGHRGSDSRFVAFAGVCGSR